MEPRIILDISKKSMATLKTPTTPKAIAKNLAPQDLVDQNLVENDWIDEEFLADITPDITDLVIEDEEKSIYIDPDLAPDIKNLIIEDGRPVDNLFSAKLQRLLVEILYSSWGRKRFFADANVGVFFALKQSALVPDVFLAVDVEAPPNFRRKSNRAYLVWEFGKSPDVAIEIVSNRKGKELGSKLQDYARTGVTYYVVFDPMGKLRTKTLQVYVLQEGHYEELVGDVTADSGEIFWLPQVELGLVLWQGTYEAVEETWLRWCDRTGHLLPTGTEEVQKQKQQIAKEKQRATKEKQRATKEKQRAEQAEARAAELLARLRELGVEE